MTAWGILLLVYVISWLLLAYRGIKVFLTMMWEGETAMLFVIPFVAFCIVFAPFILIYFVWKNVILDSNTI